MLTSTSSLLHSEFPSKSSPYYALFPNLPTDLIDDVYLALKHDSDQLINTLLQFHIMDSTTPSSLNPLPHASTSSKIKKKSTSYSILKRQATPTTTNTMTNSTTTPNSSFWKSMSRKFKTPLSSMNPSTSSKASHSNSTSLSSFSFSSTLPSMKVQDSGLFSTSSIPSSNSTSTTSMSMSMRKGEETRIILACSPWNQLTYSLEGRLLHDEENEPMCSIALH
ncbi:hypothetical protein HMI54_003178 [Coelomomyces lativittatus]|nr:hypothetical protein HMI55_000864 [Coelomomyces lativittatus]KAJ1508397.1 hypothetical protein HMI56_007310 [Coelomomyces lativittatus]KAJ1508520.1 hypothetical protein HMI54_003178 [Coelomomyces lativittatus]